MVMIAGRIGLRHTTDSIAGRTGRLRMAVPSTTGRNGRLHISAPSTGVDPSNHRAPSKALIRTCVRYTRPRAFTLLHHQCRAHEMATVSTVTLAGTEAQVLAWLLQEGLGDCAALFRTSKIDGRALLMLSAESLGKELAIKDEETQLRVCAALGPLKHRSHHPTWSAADTFANYDKDGSGSLDNKELRHALRHYGVDLTAGKVRQALARYDNEPNGTLSQDEFEALVSDIDNGVISVKKDVPAPTPPPKAAPKAAGKAAPKANAASADDKADDNARLVAEVASLRGQLAEAHLTIAQLTQRLEGDHPPSSSISTPRRRSQPSGGEPRQKRK